MNIHARLHPLWIIIFINFKRAAWSGSALFAIVLKGVSMGKRVKYIYLVPYFIQQRLSFVEPQISHFANSAPCEELVPKRHFWQTWNLRMANFDNFGGLKSLFKFHIFILSTCEESVRIGLICEELVRNFSDVKSWYSFFTNVKNSYQFLTHVKNWYSIFINVNNRYQIHMWKIGTKLSQMWIIGTQSSQMSMTESVISSHVWKILYITWLAVASDWMTTSLSFSLSLSLYHSLSYPPSLSVCLVNVNSS